MQEHRSQRNRVNTSLKTLTFLTVNTSTRGGGSVSQAAGVRIIGHFFYSWSSLAPNTWEKCRRNYIQRIDKFQNNVFSIDVKPVPAAAAVTRRLSGWLRFCLDRWLRKRVLKPALSNSVTFYNSHYLVMAYTVMAFTVTGNARILMMLAGDIKKW